MTNPGSGLSYTLGTFVETTYGTSGTPTKWNEVEKSEIKFNPVYHDSQTLRPGFLTEDLYDHVLTEGDAKGPIDTPVRYNGQGRLLGSLMGTLNTTPVQQSSTTAYKQTHAYSNGSGQSLTLEHGIPSVDQTIRRWLTVGAKVMEGQFTCTKSAGLQATFTVDAQDHYESSSSITSPTILTANPYFAWHQMVVKIGTYGSEAQVDGVMKWTGVVKRAMADKRFNAGNVTTNPNRSYAIKDEPKDNGFADISGTLETEYLSEALFENYWQTEANFSLLVIFTSATAAGTGYPYSIQFAFPCCKFLGTDATVPGPDIVKPSMPYKVLNDESHPVATISLVNTDTTL